MNWPRVRGLKFALNSEGRFKYKEPEGIVDFLVVGGGVVGLSIAQRLSQKFPTKSTYLVERHARAGEEISSRNSEVVHSGLYYPHSSLKTRLCLRGRDLLYDRCKSRGIPFMKTGKLVLARQHQLPYIKSLHEKSRALKWPLHTDVVETKAEVLSAELISGCQARDLEPDLSPDIAGALWVPATGLIDSHSFMKSLEKDILESESGQLVYNAQVVRVDPYMPLPNDSLSTGWVVQIQTGPKPRPSLTDQVESPTDAILAKTLITSMGLSGTHILNTLLPPAERIEAFYARGSYASYHGPGVANVKRLLYPCPETSAEGRESFQSLGTHLTLDLNGKIRFGPDLEWIEPPDACAAINPDFWQSYLAPSPDRIPSMHADVTSYLPNVALSGLRPDYVGIRPKLAAPSGGFIDFMVRKDYASARGYGGRWRLSSTEGALISLLGIESPGLTASLAIAEMVVEDVLNEKE